MKSSLLTIVFTLCGLLTSLTNAQVIPLTIDSSQSGVSVGVAGVSGVSTMSGTATIDLESSNPPSGNAQITDLNLVLDESVSFNFALGLLMGSTLPGDVAISLETPGNPGVISGTSFSQLANSLALGGDLNITDLFGVAGGSQTIDLSTLEIPPADFTSVEITQSGDVITVTSSFLISESVNLAAGPFDFTVAGTFVATGEAPPSEMLGDVNLDNNVDCFDISPFIRVLSTGDFQTEADLNQDEAVNLRDIFPFIGVLLSQ